MQIQLSSGLVVDSTCVFHNSRIHFFSAKMVLNFFLHKNMLWYSLEVPHYNIYFHGEIRKICILFSVEKKNLIWS